MSFACRQGDKFTLGHTSLNVRMWLTGRMFGKFGSEDMRVWFSPREKRSIRK
jgi:hypothetical protein